MKKAAWVLIVCVILSASVLLTIRMIRTTRQSSALPARDSSDSQGLQVRPTFTSENGKQVITILARGGYSPKESIAQAGVPTILRMTTKNTFDCSRALILPSLSVQKILPASGAVDIAIPAQKRGAQFYGVCSMGMYAFLITFK
jgi:hypothetical protein